jgi:hypothetical protein
MRSPESSVIRHFTDRFLHVPNEGENLIEKAIQPNGQSASAAEVAMNFFLTIFAIPSTR